MRESINNSLNFARKSFSTFTTEQPFLFVIIGLLVVRSIIAQIIKAKLKKKYLSPYEHMDNLENNQFYIDYFKKVHSVNVFGVVLVLVLLFTYVLTKDKFVGTVLAVWIWAVLLTFQTFTVSFLMYFLLMRDYKVGETIKIKGLDIQGEILNIKSLYMGIAGKNDLWESTGKYYLVPNNQIWLNVVSRVSLAPETYTKASLLIPYSNEIFDYSFDETVEKIQTFLDAFLPRRAASQVGYFKTYIGVKYKLTFSYEEEKSRIHIGWIVKRAEKAQIMRVILAFIEGLKKTPSLSQEEKRIES